MVLWRHPDISLKICWIPGHQGIAGTKQRMKKRRRQLMAILVQCRASLHHYENPSPKTKCQHSEKTMRSRKPKLIEPGGSHPDTPGSETLTQHLPSKLHAGTGSWPLHYCAKSQAYSRSFEPDILGSTVIYSTYAASNPLHAQTAPTPTNPYITTSYDVQPSKMSARHYSVPWA